MELYLDSVDINEINEAFQFGFLKGLTTTPTFLHRSGITDIDGTLLQLAKMVPILQVEALGESATEIVKEARRQVDMGLSPQTTVFKIPVSNEGLKACYQLRRDGMMVNIHLVYTIQQAYMAMEAGATYVCPLVGRLQDQGHDALALVKECVSAVNVFNYPTKIMFSSVRNAEHVRNAINLGAHTITVPWGIMKKLTENNFTKLGTDQFIEHTRAMTLRVSDIMSNQKPEVNPSDTILEGLVQMTSSGLGAVAILDESRHPLGVFTDGDLRRNLSEDSKSLMSKTFNEMQLKAPFTIQADALVFEAISIFKKKEFDNLVVLNEDGTYRGILDIQDLIRQNLIV
jgi:TalC/MipB family fructose-6-phosphate aldolase